MSSKAVPAGSFLGPLKGKTSTLVVSGRQSNLDLARTIFLQAAQDGDKCAILDLDALYSSNADAIFGKQSAEAMKSTLIHVPKPGSRVEDALTGFFGSEADVLVIDSLNTLYHLLAQMDTSSRSRKLSFAVASLSYLARTANRAAIFTMYRREGLNRSVGSRSISGLSDLMASVDSNGSELSLKCERGIAWPGGRFAIRIP